jgi:hypothetical protein
MSSSRHCLETCARALPQSPRVISARVCCGAIRGRVPARRAFSPEIVAHVFAQQTADDTNCTRRIHDVNHGIILIVRRDFDGCMYATRRRAADEQRNLKILPLHLARDVLHLIERRRDETLNPIMSTLLSRAACKILSAGTIHPGR